MIHPLLRLIATQPQLLADHAEAYADQGWYGLEVDWKFDDKYTPGTPMLYLKQARPYPPPDFSGAE